LLNGCAMRALGAAFSILLVVAGCASDDDATDDVTDDPTVAASVDPNSAEIAARVAISVERGVDRASALTVHEARVLHADHGVKWTGVYIGGPCNGGSGWTRHVVSAIAKATGWRFMPIYVGQQSASICGAHNLSYSRGHADGVAAAKHMREFGWAAHRDIPVALDVEAGAYFGNPAAATRYVRGWVNAVHGQGYRAYVYGSPYALAHFHDAHVRIDGAWAASYFYRGFKAISPYALTQMGGRYKHNNRAWQYAGNFHVSGVGYVDASTSRLLLAPKPGGTNRVRTAHREVPASCGTLAAGEGLARGESLASCDGHLVLALGDDGDLTMSRDGSVLWSSETTGAGSSAVLEDSGELVVFDAENEPVFTTGTAGFADAHADLTADGLAVIADDGTALWSSAGGMQVADDSEPVIDEAE
jgi:glycoside hydrolase-like protein